MRVRCSNVDEFLENLAAESPEDVLQKTVYVSRTEHPLDDYKVKYSVVLQASAVVCVDEDGQYLLEMGEDCGVDYRDATQAYDGSDKAAESKERIRSFCDERDLVVRPGVVDM